MVWSVCVYVCLLVMIVSPTKTVEPIEVPFGGGQETKWIGCTLKSPGEYATDRDP